MDDKKGPIAFEGELIDNGNISRAATGAYVVMGSGEEEYWKGWLKLKTLRQIPTGSILRINGQDHKIHLGVTLADPDGYSREFQTERKRRGAQE